MLILGIDDYYDFVVTKAEKCKAKDYGDSFLWSLLRWNRSDVTLFSFFLSLCSLFFFPPCFFFYFYLTIKFWGLKMAAIAGCSFPKWLPLQDWSFATRLPCGCTIHKTFLRSQNSKINKDFRSSYKRFSCDFFPTFYWKLGHRYQLFVHSKNAYEIIVGG